MANISIPTRPAVLGATAAKAAGLVAASAGHTAVLLEKGDFAAQIDWTACEIGSGDEFYLIAVQANTAAAPTVWNIIGYLAALGANTPCAGLGDTPATGSMRGRFNNPYDYQVRLYTGVNGTIATGINYTGSFLPATAGSY